VSRTTQRHRHRCPHPAKPTACPNSEPPTKQPSATETSNHPRDRGNPIVDEKAARAALTKTAAD
jgi:hypothetical protein